MKSLLALIFSLLSLQAFAEWQFVVGGKQTQVTGSTLPTGFVTSGQTGLEGGVLYEYKFSPQFAGRIGVEYMQTMINIGTSAANSTTLTETQTVVPVNLALYFMPQLYIFGGANYWTNNSYTAAGSGTNTNITAAALVTAMSPIATGFTPRAGLGFKIQHAMIEAFYDFSTVYQSTNATFTNAGQIYSIGGRVGFVF